MAGRPDGSGGEPGFGRSAGRGGGARGARGSDPSALETTVLAPAASRKPGRSGAAGRVALVELCSDFLGLVVAVRHAGASADPAALRGRALDLRREIEDRGREAGFPATDIEAANFALVALLDETVLRTRGAAHDAWLMKPLQLELYGQTVAGEEFFDRLEALRRERSTRIEALEVFFVCLALGFGGRYNLAGPEKLAEVLDEVGRDIAAVRGPAPRVLSPHLETGEEFADTMGSGVPVWLASLLFVLATATIWIVIKLLALHGAGTTADVIGSLPR